MAFSECALPAVKGIFVKCCGLFVLTKRSEAVGKVVGGKERVRVIFSEYLSSTVEGVLVKPSSLLVLAKRCQIVGKVVSCA